MMTPLHKLVMIVTTIGLVACAMLVSPGVAQDQSERLMLVVDNEARDSTAEVERMVPFDVLLVAERDAEHPQISTVVFTLDVPEGLVLVGEEILTESLIALGTPRTGINLAFMCIEAPSIDVMRFRFLATAPMQDAAISLLPDTRTNFRGIVSCNDEKFAQWDTEPSSVHVTVR
jgi:hypothetical protein